MAAIAGNIVPMFEAQIPSSLYISKPQKSLPGFIGSFLLNHPVPSALESLFRAAPLRLRASPHSNPKRISVFADEPRKGSDVLAEALEGQGVTNVSGYTDAPAITLQGRNVRLLSAPDEPTLSAGQYLRSTDSFNDGAHEPVVAMNEMDTIADVIQSIENPNYRGVDIVGIPSIVGKAFSFETSGRRGSVWIGNLKDTLQRDQSMGLPSYMSRLPKPPNEVDLKRPVHGNVGGGCWGLNPGKGWKRLPVLLLGVLIATTLMPGWAYSLPDEWSPQTAIIHGPLNGNYAWHKTELSVAPKVKFGDNWTGELKISYSRAKGVYSPTDPMAIGNTNINTGVGQPQTIMRASTASFPAATIAGLAIGLGISAFALWVFPNRKAVGTSKRRGKTRKP